MLYFITRLFRLSTLLLALTALPSHALLIADTGPGTGSRYREASFGFSPGAGIAAYWYSGEFSLKETTTITKVETWMQWVDQNSDPLHPTGEVGIQISARNGWGYDILAGYDHPIPGVPDAPLFSAQYTLTGQDAPRWEAFDVAVELQPGTYWISVLDAPLPGSVLRGEEDNDGFVARLYTGVPRPLTRYLYQVSDAAVSGYLELDPTVDGMGFRISAIPEPDEWLLILVGIALVSLASRRRGRSSSSTAELLGIRPVFVHTMHD
jgi:hypothetical protein